MQQYPYTLLEGEEFGRPKNRKSQQCSGTSPTMQFPFLYIDRTPERTSSIAKDENHLSKQLKYDLKFQGGDQAEVWKTVCYCRCTKTKPKEFLMDEEETHYRTEDSAALTLVRRFEIHVSHDKVHISINDEGPAGEIPVFRVLTDYNSDTPQSMNDLLKNHPSQYSVLRYAQVPVAYLNMVKRDPDLIYQKMGDGKPTTAMDALMTLFNWYEIEPQNFKPSIEFTIGGWSLKTITGPTPIAQIRLPLPKELGDHLLSIPQLLTLQILNIKVGDSESAKPVLIARWLGEEIYSKTLTNMAKTENSEKDKGLVERPVYLGKLQFRYIKSSSGASKVRLDKQQKPVEQLGEEESESARQENSRGSLVWPISHVKNGD